MANGRNARPKGDAGRDTGGFVAIPWPVLDSAAYKGLSHPAKALLIEMAQARIDRGRADSRNRQGPPSEQGELVCGDMAGAGQTSGYDPGAAATFGRGAYKAAAALTITPTREENFAKWRRPPTSSENAMCRPSPGASVVQRVGGWQGRAGRHADRSTAHEGSPS